MHRSIAGHNSYNLFILTKGYSKIFTTRKLPQLGHVAMLVVKSIVIQINGHCYGSINYAGPLCRVNPLTNSGKRFQLMKILCLTVIPILGVWGFTMYSLSDSVKSKTEIEMVRRLVPVRCKHTSHFHYKCSVRMFQNKTLE